DLVGDEVIGGQDGAIARERRDYVVGQDAFLVDCKGERHDAKSPMTPEYCPPISTQTASVIAGHSASSRALTPARLPGLWAPVHALTTRQSIFFAPRVEPAGDQGCSG